MRIGIAHLYGLTGSGSAIYVSRLAETLASRGHYVGVLCYEEHPENYPFIDLATRGRSGNVVTLFQRRPNPICWLHQLSGLAPVAYPRVEASDRPLFTQLTGAQIAAYLEDLTGQLVDIVRHHRLDMLHVNHEVPLPAIAAQVKRRMGIPYIVTVHGSMIEFVINRDERYRPYAYAGLAHADRVIVLNRDVWARTEALCPVARLTEIPVGVNTELFVPDLTLDREVQQQKLLAELISVDSDMTVRDAASPSPDTIPPEVIALVLAGGKGTRMKSDLPKVLHTVHGRSLVQHVVDRIRLADVQDIIMVVGYRREMVMEHMGTSVRYAMQEQQLGTAHAVMAARPYLADFTGRVLVVYGDMPLINPASIRRLIDRCQGDVKAALLAIILENPPDFGRVVRGPDGSVARIVEVKDADPHIMAIKEVNVGMYCFDCRALLAALDRATHDNAQGEYYLTDVIELIAGAGGRVETIVASSLEETLGINDPDHLRFAESLSHLDYAESLYPLVDASLSLPFADEQAKKTS
jgi:bifunctional UDP-N-acetylglucosamine pyrophosphorylase/glucosamine-1-phosphate N-acetyltransferase